MTHKGGSFPLSNKFVRTIVNSIIYDFDGTGERPINANTVLTLRHHDTDNNFKWLVVRDDPVRGAWMRIHRDDLIQEPPVTTNIIVDAPTNIMYIIDQNQIRPNVYSTNPVINLLCDKTVGHNAFFKCIQMRTSFDRRFKTCFGCRMCGIAYQLEQNMANGQKLLKFATGETVAMRYEHSSCWVNKQKVSGDDIYFQCISNEHIETITTPPNSYQHIEEACSKDADVKRSFLSYLLHMVNDSFRFARNVLGIDAKYVQPRSSGYEKYDKMTINNNTLCIIVHKGDNSMPHVHFHCYINRNNDKFEKSIKDNSFIESDLFDGFSDMSTTIEYLYSTIAKSITNTSGQQIPIRIDQLVLSRYDTTISK
jgi:hypothetical protein